MKHMISWIHLWKYQKMILTWSRSLVEAHSEKFSWFAKRIIGKSMQWKCLKRNRLLREIWEWRLKVSYFWSYKILVIIQEDFSCKCKPNLMRYCLIWYSWEGNFGKNKKSIHRRPSLCFLDWWKAVLYNGLLEWRWAVLAFEKGYQIFGEKGKILCSWNRFGNWDLARKWNNL